MEGFELMVEDGEFVLMCTKHGETKYRCETDVYLVPEGVRREGDAGRPKKRLRVGLKFMCRACKSIASACLSDSRTWFMVEDSAKSILKKYVSKAAVEEVGPSSE
jgi:hypothetical protein